MISIQWRSMLLVFGLWVVACSGFDSEPPEDRWRFNEEDRGTPLKPGLYSLEVEIQEDGCEPSLNRVMDEVPEWPIGLTAANITSYVENDEHFAYLQVWLPVLRLSVVDYFPTARLDRSFRALPGQFYETVWPEELYIQNACPWSPHWARFRHHISGYEIEEEGVVRVDVNIEWLDYSECEDDLDDIATPWVPVEQCEESYSYRLRLQEACVPWGECSANIYWDGLGGDSTPSIREASCMCNTDYERPGI